MVISSTTGGRAGLIAMQYATTMYSKAVNFCVAHDLAKTSTSALLAPTRLQRPDVTSSPNADCPRVTCAGRISFARIATRRALLFLR